MDVIRDIDLFAGIGGIRLGLTEACRAQGAGHGTVFASEWNRYSAETYRANFPTPDVAGDITGVDAASIPDFDVLLAGFPCQPFSIAGVSKKRSLGRPTGFADRTQGTLFFEVARILDERRPAAFLLENVKNLTSHDGGNTFRVIMDTLERELGYHVQWKVIDAARFRPQHRERIYIVGFRGETDFSFDNIRYPSHVPVVGDVLEDDVPDKYTLSDRLWEYLQAYAAKHRAAGNGFGYGLVTPESARTRTISARYHKDGSECLVWQGEGRNPRRLTPRECARLQGFPDSFVIPVSDTQAYRQFGNSVCVPAVRAVAVEMVRVLKGM